VHLPQMAVSSSVMDLEVSGTHGFDGQVDDHLNFRLGDLLRTTARQATDGYGPVIDDGTGLRIFLHMYGTTSDHLQFGQRRRHGRRQAASERMKQETAQLKGILKGVVSRCMEPHRRKSAPEAAATRPDRRGIRRRPGAAASPDAQTQKGLGRLLQKDEKEQPQVVIGVE
jgi:hypothetical protein